MEVKSQNFRLNKRSKLRKAEKLFYVHVPQIKDDTVEVEDENSAPNFGSVRCVFILMVLKHHCTVLRAENTPPPPPIQAEY
jgi:hypothetical protein